MKYVAIKNSVGYRIEKSELPVYLNDGETYLLIHGKKTEDLDSALLRINQEERGGEICTGECRWTCHGAPSIIGCSELQEDINQMNKISRYNRDIVEKKQSEKLEMIKNIVNDSHNSFEVKIIKLKGILND